ncbi:MAG: hypothetical protein KJZ78_22480, partial [Bryobacteraceae bacterium]|nr:hypothetical protein [Bryobacteraceae bacterium]
EPQASYVGMALSAFIDELHSNHLVWAPDGDEAFADGSYVLQFDKDEKVRLIAFKSTAGVDPDEGTVSDVWLSADDFYHCLDEWLNMFDAQWREAPKVTVL